MSEKTEATKAADALQAWCDNTDEAAPIDEILEAIEALRSTESARVAAEERAHAEGECLTHQEIEEEVNDLGCRYTNADCSSLTWQEQVAACVEERDRLMRERDEARAEIVRYAAAERALLMSTVAERDEARLDCETLVRECSALGAGDLLGSLSARGQRFSRAGSIPTPAPISDYRKSYALMFRKAERERDEARQRVAALEALLSEEVACPAPDCTDGETSDCSTCATCDGEGWVKRKVPEGTAALDAYGERVAHETMRHAFSIIEAAAPHVAKDYTDIEEAVCAAANGLQPFFVCGLTEIENAAQAAYEETIRREEREACAEVAESFPQDNGAENLIAAAIRARGDK